MGKFAQNPDIRMKVRMKSYVGSYRHTTRDFSGQDKFLGTKALDKHFMHDIQKEGLHREKLPCFFSKIFLKLHFKRELNQ